MSEVRTTPITTKYDGANDLTQFYSFLKCFHLFHISIDQRTQTGIAFLDFSKAFNSVSLSHLIRRLDQSGIKDPLLQWFTSYLTGRMHRDPYLGLLCLPYLSTICRVLCLTQVLWPYLPTMQSVFTPLDPSATVNGVMKGSLSLTQKNARYAR